MIKSLRNPVLDDADRSILQELQREGNISTVELARRIHLSTPATHTRLKRLENDGYIQRYAAILDHDKLGYDLLCFVHIALQLHQSDPVERIHTALRQMPQVLECHHITGEYDLILKVAVKNRQDLEHFLMRELTPLGGMSRIHTSLVLNQVKTNNELPISNP
jgi:DNA-binding Lrp family transcriptional regulator